MITTSYLSFISSISAIKRESSSPELEPDELPAEAFPLLLLPPSLTEPAPADTDAHADDDDEEPDVDVDALAMVFGTFDGCVSHRSASCVNSWIARAAAAFGVSLSTIPLEAQYLLLHFGLPHPSTSW